MLIYIYIYIHHIHTIYYITYYNNSTYLKNYYIPLLRSLIPPLPKDPPFMQKINIASLVIV